jgi:hypothetical protein
MGKEAVFLGDVTGEHILGKSILNVRNKVHAGDEVEILQPGGSLAKTKLPIPLKDTYGEEIDYASHGTQIILDSEFPKYSVVTKI